MDFCYTISLHPVYAKGAYGDLKMNLYELLKACGASRHPQVPKEKQTRMTGR